MLDKPETLPDMLARAALEAARARASVSEDAAIAAGFGGVHNEAAANALIDAAITVLGRGTLASVLLHLRAAGAAENRMTATGSRAAARSWDAIWDIASDEGARCLDESDNYEWRND